MKTAKDLKVGDTCYMFSYVGEFKGKVKVESIDIDDEEPSGNKYHFKIKYKGHKGDMRASEDTTYKYSYVCYEYQSGIIFFSKEAAIKHFLNKLESSVQTIKDSMKKLYNID